MTDKIKLKADKFVNDKKLKLNYIKPKDLKILLAEFCEEQMVECDLAIEDRDVKIKELEKQIDKTKYALKKIIETVQNDNISSYGERLVIIKDISYEILQELEK